MNATMAYLEHDTDGEDVNRLVKDHLELVRRIVGQMSSQIRDMVSDDDLVSAGTVGLVEAAHRYDSEREATFVTFAYRRIKGSIMDYLRDQDVLSKSARNRFDKLRELIRQFREERGRKPSIKELADMADLPPKSVLKSLAHEKWNYITSLDNSLKDGQGGETRLSSLVPASTDTPLEKLEHEEQVRMLEEGIKTLSDRQKQVIVMYYYEELYMREIAEVLEVSESRVSQIHTEALYELGRYLEGDHNE